MLLVESPCKTANDHRVYRPVEKTPCTRYDFTVILGMKARPTRVLSVTSSKYFDVEASGIVSLPNDNTSSMSGVSNV
jgi:hypothetical protein